MIFNQIPISKRVFFFFFVTAWFSSPCVIAAPLEDINLSVETDRVVATIRLSGPVANVRYTPAKKGISLSILLDKINTGLAPIEWLDNEVLKSPPSSLIPAFTVKTNLRNIQPRLIIDFSREAEYTVNMGKDGRSIVVGIKIDKALPKFDGNLPFLPEVQPLPENANDINKQAFVLMQKGRNALAESDNIAAIDTYNKLLLLPPNDYTQDGQEWVGVARERAGQLDKAKLEYELYLKLYTNPEDATRIKARIATLGKKPFKPLSLTKEPVNANKKPTQTLSYGSVSMHYYQGNSKVDTQDNSPELSGNPLSQSTFTAKDQSAILTTVVATQRFISDEYDNRMVFQDTAYSNLLPEQVSKNRLSAAYFELRNRLSDYSARLGRQSSSGGGVMGRFDGASLGFGVTPSVRFNAVMGQLSDYDVGSKPRFYGVNTEIGPATIYAIQQTIDGVSDRKAIGTELRFFKTNMSLFGLLDYDISFHDLNVALLQGTYTPIPERTFNYYLDHRKTPYLSTRNALNGALTTSLTDLLQFMTEEEVRMLAGDRTGTSDLLQFGILEQVTPRWQIGADVRASRFGALPASGIAIIDPNIPDPIPTVTGLLPATDASGNEWAFTPQLIGSNLFSSSDITIFNFSYLFSPLYRGQSMYIYSRANFTEKLSLDGSVQVYRQNFDSGTVMTRVMPTLRVAYQFRQELSFDMDVGLETSHSESGTQVTDTQRKFFSLGFRKDF